MSNLVLPHGGELRPRLVKSEELAKARKRAAEIPKVRMTSRETSDLIMIGVGILSPVGGFMARKDWEEVW
jgi:sulfate adenylyltransferase